MMNRFRRVIASLLVVSLTCIGMPLPAQAGMIATESLVSQGDRARIAAVLERAEMQARLQAYGVSVSELKARAAALTDDEAAELAARIDSLPAGGESMLGVLLLMPLIVFLVLLFTDIMGWTKIFPFTRPVK